MKQLTDRDMLRTAQRALREHLAMRPLTATALTEMAVAADTEAAAIEAHATTRRTPTISECISRGERGQHVVFNEVDAVVIGISGQSVESHKKFAQENKLNYTILSDEKNVVRKLFGVPSRVFGLIPGRVTYVADRSGKVVYIFDSQKEVQRHADEALKICLVLKRTEFV